jgi:3-dehydroquinate synthase
MTMRAMGFETRPGTSTQYLVGAGALMDERLTTVLAGVPVCAVVDEDVMKHHGDLLAGVVSGPDCLGSLGVAGGEHCKSLEQLTRVLDFLSECGLPKHGVVVAIGGGTICDVVSLAAMLMRRSIPLVLIPTTLLAQVDAAIGGKNGINFGRTKNLVGHFYHPTVVACDQAFLATLPAREIVSGIAECIKIFAVADREALARHSRRWQDDRLFCESEGWQDSIWDAVRWKLTLLAEDPYERSSRRLLNYGHAFAHFLEEQSGYRLLHGEAVLLGMMVENEVSRELGIGGPALDPLQALTADFLSEPCRRHWPPFADVRRELPKLRQMRRGQMNLVCLVEPGDGRIVDDVDEAVLAEAWRRVERRLDPCTAVNGLGPSEAADGPAEPAVTMRAR